MSDKLKKPERAKSKFKRITTKGDPGGPHTPGAKKKRAIKDGSAEGHKLTGVNQ